MTQRRHTRRQYPRMARVNELLREILADALERLDDDRLALVVITDVDCEADLKRATVFVDSLNAPAGEDAVLEALAENRHRLQGAVARQARLKNTPELAFATDEVVRTADRIEQVLRDLDDGSS